MIYIYTYIFNLFYTKKVKTLKPCTLLIIFFFQHKLSGIIQWKYEKRPFCNAFTGDLNQLHIKNILTQINDI